MKNIFSNKFVIAITIIVVAGGATYFTTWGNKNWLLRRISEKGGDVTTLQQMGVSDLRKKLKTLS